MRFLMIGISIIIGVILVGVVFSVTTDLTQPKEVEQTVNYNGIEVGIIEENNGFMVPQLYDTWQSIFINKTITNVVIYDNVNELLTYNPIFVVNNQFIYISYYTDIELTSHVSFDIKGAHNIDPYDMVIFNTSPTSLNIDLTVIYLEEEAPQISSTSAILIALVPLLFATGVILYTYNTALRGREE